MSRKSDCIRFFESQRAKMEQLMRVGDIVSHERVRRTCDDSEGRARQVMELLKQEKDGKSVYSVDGACRYVGIGHCTYLKKKKEIEKRNESQTT